MASHVAIIMDGNRRWATARSLPLAEGYRRGVTALRAAIEGALAAGVGTLTVFGFSTENWNREASEIALLMHLCAQFATGERRALQAQRVRVRVLGDADAFTFPARIALRNLERATDGNRALTLNLALNYSGRAELLRATRRLTAQVAQGKLQPSEIDEAMLRGALDAPQMPDPDLLIRTGGELRVSNFLLYQIAYTELLCLPLLWPDFTQEHFARAVGAYGSRIRRFGG